MASVKGRERSLTKFLFAQRTMAKKAQPKHIAKRVAAENQRQDRHIPRSFDPIEKERGEFLTSVLVSPELKSALAQGCRSFGIAWHPTTPIAQGPSIEPFAHIFDRFVQGCWKVRVVYDIDGFGTPGWLFERG